MALFLRMAFGACVTWIEVASMGPTVVDFLTGSGINRSGAIDFGAGTFGFLALLVRSVNDSIGVSDILGG